MQPTASREIVCILKASPDTAAVADGQAVSRQPSTSVPSNISNDDTIAPHVAKIYIRNEVLMLNDDDVSSQQQLLQVHRRTLAHLLQQVAAHGCIAFASPATANGITEARSGIARCKAALRRWGITIEDLPGDEEEPLSTSLDPAPPVGPTGLRPGQTFNFYAPVHSGVANFGGEQQIGEVHMTMGDNINISNVSGSILNVKSTLTDVTQRIDGLPNTDQATKDELKLLIDELSELLQQAPTGNAEDAAKVAKRAEAAIDEASKPQPDKELVAFNVESLKRAAANIAAVLPAVLPIATKIAGHILALAG